MKTKLFAALTLVILVALGSGCTTYTTQVDNTPGRPTTYEAVDTPGSVQGVGMESQDIASMTDRMARDILANPFWYGTTQIPRIIVDSKYFENDSSTRINKNIITDRLRVELTRASRGRMVFIGRHYANMVEHERKLKSQGVVDQGTKAPTQKTMGADYRMGGRITTRDVMSPQTGRKSRFTQIVFEIVDLNSSALVWTGMYDFKKSSQDSLIYR